MTKLYNPDNIRLIVTDMDGTLLNTAKQLPWRKPSASFRS